MFKKITDWMGGSKNNLEAQYMKDHDISYHIILNRATV